MKKIYCIDCKYKAPKDHDCYKCINAEAIENFRKKYNDEFLIQYGFLLNDKFDCKYYKRKWWKFWVKSSINKQRGE
jgi:hypothetical protein